MPELQVRAAEVVQRGALVADPADFPDDAESLRRPGDRLLVPPEFQVRLAEVAQRDTLAIPAADLALQFECADQRRDRLLVPPENQVGERQVVRGSGLLPAARGPIKDS